MKIVQSIIAVIIQNSNRVHVIIIFFWDEDKFPSMKMLEYNLFWEHV